MNRQAPAQDKRLLWISSLLAFLALLAFASTAMLFYMGATTSQGAWFFGILFGFCAVPSSSLIQVVASDAARRLKQAEEVARAEPTPARIWDVGTARLESYLVSHLAMTNRIAWATLVASIGGLILLGVGAVLLWNNPEQPGTATVPLVSGALVQLITPTLIYMFRSSTDRMVGYVKVLERMAGVGMAVQLVEELDPARRAEAKAALSTKLLAVYTINPGDDPLAHPTGGHPLSPPEKSPIRAVE